MKFPSLASEFVFYRTYSRWLPESMRRETYEEMVDRSVTFLRKLGGEKVPEKVYRKIKQNFLDMAVFPSMRLAWSAGAAAEASNICLYNCSFLSIDSVESFSEALYILCCGTGVGFSVERRYVSQLPVVARCTGMIKPYTVADSKEGWADSVKGLMYALYDGRDLDVDYSLIRPAGTRLKTMGGRASGPEPLKRCHDFIRQVFKGAIGRQLTTLECHDIMCVIADIVISGGVRRSAMISIGDLDDELLRNAKVGDFPTYRFMSNNSAIYHTKPSPTEFMREWLTLAESNTGERGIFNKEAAIKNVPSRRQLTENIGVNPCCEILLRAFSFCNLSEWVVREGDDIDTLLRKVETAVWIGAIQSCATNFPYLRPIWKANCEDERLLGVSLTGQMDNPTLLTPENLDHLKKYALKIAKRASKVLGINFAAAVTCGKPSGTVSQLAACSSGLHVRWSKHVIRRYRISARDPLFHLLRDQGVPCCPEVGQTTESATTWVLEFPEKAPDTAIVKGQMTAIEQLEWYRKIQQHWCEHNASCTIYVKPDEWLAVGHWVYTNWGIVNGLSFLADDGGVYQLAPYEAITEEEYNQRLITFPKIDFSKLSQYELEDHTEGAKTYACTGDHCELR